MIYGDKIYKPYKFLLPTPAEIPLETTCVTIALPADAAWIGLWIGALLPLIDAESFQQLEGGISRETTAEIFEAALFDALLLAESACELIPAPFWDDATDNEIEMPSDDQVWYGSVTDWLAPVDSLNFEQNIALWALTGFVAYAAGLGSAIFFRTTAKRFVLAFESSNVEEIVRIVIDAASFNSIIPANAGIVSIDIVADTVALNHDIYIIRGE